MPFTRQSFVVLKKPLIKVYETGLGLAMFSVGFWVDYFAFGTICFGDPEDIRKLFGRASSYVGKDCFCHTLWGKYMNNEFNQQRWNFFAQSCIQALRFPNSNKEATFLL